MNPISNKAFIEDFNYFNFDINLSADKYESDSEESDENVIHSNNFFKSIRRRLSSTTLSKNLKPNSIVDKNTTFLSLASPQNLFKPRRNSAHSTSTISEEDTELTTSRLTPLTSMKVASPKSLRNSLIVYHLGYEQRKSKDNEDFDSMLKEGYGNTRHGPEFTLTLTLTPELIR